MESGVYLKRTVPSTSQQILVLVRDLMFSGRISAEARAAGINIKIIRDPAQVSAGDQPASYSLMLLDLNLPGAIEAAVEFNQRTSAPTIGFVSHVDAATIAKARGAGITQVLPRSRFVQLLPQLLRDPLSAPPSETEEKP